MDDEVILGRWLLGPQISSGAFGVVYRAREVAGRGPDVAVKRLTSDNPEAAERMARVSEVVATFEHPGIARVIASGEGVLVMELVPGGRTLRNTIGESAPMSMRDAADRFVDLLDAVMYAHALGVVHRDLKPENILEDVDSGQPKLIDFDLAKLQGSNYTRAHTQTGSWPYAAPELSNARTATAAADTYSLGVILHELLSGVRPISASTNRYGDPHAAWRAPSQFNARVPCEVDDLIARMMRFNPRERPRTPDEYSEMRRLLATYL
jgi:serine/threonine-protein kinase